ncbi:pyruvate formate-lyase activating enzyme [Olsenella uli DSM 7084]|uniref:Pyruvate formate-lyase-activating enzyme n=1 Tax=Olsenella uli (strain ATCC 49627 / DSM 7084 / CCUG 31166 / CIP 109912 / JCM 12494 / LMG 11480 / NCIMB 702895 / VPI D76D-27C) TaxID=633147 RepID=E1QYF8_OLSUV|nr:pyruvate formate-lyase-activating protein [Olsenella uli]ADK67422.1 pyruvate formate-lyase activating enzyme [Olsenella uli DSM 7084]
MLGRVHSTESFGSADGPGVRFLIFLQGCPMRCRYCHNVDTWPLDKGSETSADDLLDKAERYRGYWGPQGGITVSGGEALLQAEFVLELFTKAHERHVNTCLDSSLAPFTRTSPFFDTFVQLMGVTDLVLADIKHIDAQEHRSLTGHGNENILDCLRYLSEARVPVWIRHVLVPGITDNDGYLRRTRGFIETLDNVERIEVLPYHSLGAYKWEQLNIPYTLGGVQPPSHERVINAERILRGEQDVPLDNEAKEA